MDLTPESQRLHPLIIFGTVVLVAIIVGGYAMAPVKAASNFFSACVGSPPEKEGKPLTGVQCACIYTSLVTNHSSDEILLISAFMANDQATLREFTRTRGNEWIMWNSSKVLITLQLSKQKRNCG